MSQEIEFSNTMPFELPEEENGVYANPIKLSSPKAKYCLYARKSTEDDERQALSIDSQIKAMTNQAEVEGLNVIEVRTESHSAKSTGQRPIFNQLIAEVRSGVFQGILSWAPDRLSRNAGDLGSLVDLMDNGYLKEIRTHGQIFTNSPNDKFLLMILCSQAKLENDNRGVNVKRGMKTKCELGYRPSLTPLGYLNDKLTNKGQKKIYHDPARAPIVREMFEKVAHQGYSGRKVYLWLRDEIDFRTRTGKPITLSAIYRMLNNPYYTGIFEAPIGSGQWYKGSYEPIVSKELFKQVQTNMAVPPKTMPGTKGFQFTRILKCASCGSGVTAQEKIKKSGRRYVYYHCHKIKNFKCEEPYIREEKLIEEFERVLGQLSIEQIKSKREIYNKFKEYGKCRSDITEFELKENQANEIDLERVIINKFVFHIFKFGSKEDKRELISCLNTTLYLKDRAICTK